ncbi:serine-rich adhesin for platelets-like isoform X2 [Dysidea avara]|uniref:serine-rich adhesin for platelets-like isoform X2 n=1 Tax=Dysidea avara TaxID=196820 RepID=UPI003329DBC1
MSVELLRLTSASLPLSAKQAHKPVIPNVGTFHSSIFSPLPKNDASNEFALRDGGSHMTENKHPTSSPITIKACDTSTDLFGISAQSSPISSHDGTPSRDSRSIQSTLLTGSDTSTPGSIRVKISPNKLMEIPSPIPNKTKSPDNAAAQTPPRALGIPTNMMDKESYGRFQEKPNTKGKLVKKVLPQGVIRTGSATTLDESNTDDSIVAVSQNCTDHVLVKQRLAQQKQSNPKKQCITVHPNVVQPNHNVIPQGVTPSETKSVQTEMIKQESPLFFDEGTQCVEEKLPLRTRGVQTSPCDYGHPMKQHPGQSLTSEITELIPPTNTTSLLTSQLTTDTVTLIASTAAAAAVAASTSLHGNNTHTEAKENCLNLQTQLKSASTNVALRGHNATTQTDREIRDDNSRRQAVNEHEITSPSHPYTAHPFTDVTVNSQISRKSVKKGLDHPFSGERDSQLTADLIKQKFEKTAIDDAFAVLRSTSIAEQEVEHHCTSLEHPSTLTDFTDAMILGKPIEEKMRIHQQISKLIEQHKDDDGLADEPKQTMTQLERSKVETENKPRMKRQSSTKKATVKNVKRRNRHDDVTKLRHYRHGNRLDYKTDAICKLPVPVTSCDYQYRMKTTMPSAVPLGPPRQSHSYPTVVTKHVKSVSCQVSPVSPKEIKKDQKVLKKPDMSTYSIKVLSPVNISTSSDATEPTVLQAGKPDVTVYNDFHNSFQQSDTTTVDHRTGDGITLEGENVPVTRDYHGPSFPPKPAERLSPNVECFTMSSSELDKKLQEILEEKALDWVQQELLARLAANKRHDPVGHTVNSCSTCSTETPDDAVFGLRTAGMQEIPLDNECVKNLVCEEVLDLIKGLLKDNIRTKQQQSQETLVTQANDDLVSESLSSHENLSTPTITPSSTPVNLQSTASSLDHVRIVTTPLPTPPQSPTPSACPQTDTSITSEIIRIPTPKSSLDSSTGDEIDSLVGHTQPTKSVILSSPNTTPPTIRSIHSPPESSEIVIEEKEDQVIIEPVAKQPTEPILTESSSTTSSPAVSETSTTTSDHEISMGEYILAKPAVLQRLKQPDYSISEGEVPISPGDARWHSTHASKLRGKLKENKKGKPPVLEAFLDLKQLMSSEKDSDTDFSSDSLQQPKQLLSEGEVLHHDPYKKFLDKLDSSNSSVTVQEDENTLSEVTSFLTHDDQSSITSPPPHVRSTGRSKKDVSPGEATRNISVLVKPPHNEDDISVGEVARTSQMTGQVSRSSPGEIPPILRASETRDGIDVIRVSRWSDKLSSDAQYLMEEFESTDTIQVSSQNSSSVNKQGSNSQQSLGHDSARSSTETYTHPSNQHKSHTELNRKSVTINIPTTAGFQSDANESTSEVTFSISEMSPESSENF